MIKAKKSLGQNFLIDQNVIDKIINLIQIKNKSILEIGPGTGNLTKNIIKKNPKKILLVEKDSRFLELLNKDSNPIIKIINQDVLKIDENKLDDDVLTVFGNLPYNISTEILSKWIINLKDNFWFDFLILMFQKEVANRIVANFNTSNYGRLSIICNWKLKIKKICNIKPEAFFPKPKIESSLLYFYPKKNFIKIKDPKNLEKITRIFFNQRRKMIKKAFNQIFNGNNEIIKKNNIDLKLRPQNLNFETYYKLTQELETLRS